MANNNSNNKAADAVALLKKDFDLASEFLSVLPDDATEDQKENAAKAVEVAKSLLENEISKNEISEQNKKGNQNIKKVKIKFVKTPAGMFLLPHHVGQIDSFNKAQAEAIVEAGFAEFVK
jgi:Trp operon repressor